MSNLIAWYGLPGAGKSTHLEKLRASGHLVFDDFMKKSIRDDPQFPFSRYFVDIVTALRRSEPCAVADIRLCERPFRRDVTEILTELVAGLSVRWHCFDCRTAEAVQRCRDNVVFRSERTNRRFEHALRSIDDIAPRFTVEEGAEIYEVMDARLATSNPR